MLKVGFLGLGVISRENVLGYLGSEDAEIVAVSCLDQAEADTWLKEHDLAHVKYYEDYERMLEEEDLDIVEILTPNHLHHSHALRCAEMKVKAISLQKPMAKNLRECSEIIEVCRENGVKLKIYENFLFYPVYVKAKELIRQDLIGELISIRIHTMTGLKEGGTWPWCFDADRIDLESAGFGPLTGDDGHHKVALARWFMEREFEKVSAWIDPTTPLDAPAMIRVRLKELAGDHPKYAQLDFSFSPKLKIPFDFWFDDFLEIVGTRGIMWINQCSAAGDRKMFKGNRMSESAVFPPIAVFVGGKVETYLEALSLSERNWSSSFVDSTRHFIEVVKNSEAPVLTGEEGMEIVRCLLSIHVSAQENREIYLDEVVPEAEDVGRIRVRTNFCNPDKITSYR